MRLTCPNCGAQYEVPNEVIPFDGRDVQCSNCGDTWFQGHPENPDTATDALDEAPISEVEVAEVSPEPEREPEPEPEPEPQAEVASAIEPEAEIEPEIAPEPEAQPKPEIESSDDQEPQPSEPEVAEISDPPTLDISEARPDIDAGISSILREEAEREVNLRNAESGPLESQADLGLDNVGDASGQRGQGIRNRMARLRGEQPAAVAETGRELLPDIEEINSAWDTPGDGAPQSGELTEVQAQAREQRGGFVRGFAIIVMIGVLMTLVYAKAPMIADMLPVAEPALDAYVDMIDQGRIWLDAKIGAMVPAQGN